MNNNQTSRQSNVKYLSEILDSYRLCMMFKRWWSQFAIDKHTWEQVSSDKENHKIYLSLSNKLVFPEKFYWLVSKMSSVLSAILQDDTLSAFMLYND